MVAVDRGRFCRTNIIKEVGMAICFLALLTLIAQIPIQFAATLAPTYVVPAFVPDEEVPEMEYTYVEANYLWTDSDNADDTLDGWELTGSLELPLNFFAQVTVSQQSGDADFDQYRIGAGYHLPLGSRLDAFGILSVAHAEVDGSGDDFDDTGIAGELGLRMLVTPKIEVNGSAEWADVDDSEYGAGIGARYYLGNRMSLGGRVESIDSDESFAAGLRFEF